VVVFATGSPVVHREVRCPAPNAVYVGPVFAPDGLTLYASGGGSEIIRRYAVTDGKLTEQPPPRLPTSTPDGVQFRAARVRASAGSRAWSGIGPEAGAVTLRISRAPVRVCAEVV
jgi:hypothetical protein